MVRFTKSVTKFIAKGVLYCGRTKEGFQILVKYFQPILLKNMCSRKMMLVQL